MTDQEREQRAVRMLRVSGCVVEHRNDGWLIAEGRSGVLLRIGTLSALVALAEMRFANVSGQQSITPSA
jgi:hypothetical protein